MVRLIDIAKELNLNVSVISRALNPNPDKHTVIKEETLELIKETAKKMGYRPNRQASFLKKGGNATLLCYLPGSADRMIADLMFGISEAAAKEGFPLTFFSGANSRDFSKFLEEAMNTKHSGLMTYPPGKMDHTARSVFERYLEHGGKVLMMNIVSNFSSGTAFPKTENLVHLNIDDAYGSALAVKHFSDNGCTCIRYTGQVYQERLRGILETAEKLNIDCKELDWNELQILKRNKIKVGIFAFRDTDGLNVLTRLAVGKYEIGTQVQVIGFDDISQSLWSEPSLSSIHQPTRQEGRRAVEKLINMIFDKKETDETIKPYLMVRESTGGSRPDPGNPETETIIF